MIKVRMAKKPKRFNLVPQLSRVLIQMPSYERTTEGGIVLLEETQRTGELDAMVGKVVALGPLAYTDTAVFGPDPQPACKKGDWVILKRYVGEKITTTNEAGEKVVFRLVFDDAILATTRTPQLINGV